MDSHFWSGMRLVVRGLIDAAEKASYSVGAGGLFFGLALAVTSKFAALSGGPGTIISIGCFLLAARLGRSLDQLAERRIQRARMEERESAERLEERHHLNYRFRRDLEHLHEREFELTKRLESASPQGEAEIQRQLAILRHRERDLEQLRRDVQDKLESFREEAVDALQRRLEPSGDSGVSAPPNGHVGALTATEKVRTTRKSRVAPPSQKRGREALERRGDSEDLDTHAEDEAEEADAEEVKHRERSAS